MGKYKQISKVLIIVLFLNFSVAILKLIIGYTIKSESISADGFHSLTDSFSNIVGLIGIKIASKPADKNHPYGHKKFETLTGLLIGVMLIFITIKIITGVVQWFINPFSPTVTNTSLIVIVLTLFVNIIASTYEYKKAKQLNSDILYSDSLNTRSDILVTSSVLITLIGIRLGLPAVIDPIASLIVAVIIVFASIKIFRSTTAILVDENRVDVDLIKNITLEFKDVLAVNNIRSRGRNDDLHIDMTIKTNPTMNIEEFHQLIHRIEEKLREKVNESTQLVVHAEPNENK